jgi:cathepsin B
MYLEANGVRTEECMPYQSGDGSEWACPAKDQCSDEGKKQFPEEKFKKYFISDYNTYSQNPETIKQELSDNGPMELSFTVYQDFMTYKKGIYKHVSGSQLGGHAVKLLGYGKDAETGQEYFYCENSWGEKWGDGGYFKIEIGDSNNDKNLVAAVVDYKP